MTHIIDFLNGEHRRVEKLLLVLEEELAVFDCQERPDYEVLQTLVRFFEDYAGSRHEAGLMPQGPLLSINDLRRFSSG